MCLLFIGALSTFAQSIGEARKLTDSEQYEAASAMYKQLLLQKANDASIYYFFGDNMLSADDPDSANILFVKGNQIEPGNALIKIGQAKLLLNTLRVLETKIASDKDPSNTELRKRFEDATSNVNKAKVLINEATVIPAKDPVLFIEGAEALIHYKNQDLDKAKDLLDKAAGLDPKNPEINLLYGDLYGEKNNGSLAADFYNKALEQDKGSARGIVSKGRLYKRSTNYEDAAKEFEKAIALDPNYAPAHRELGEVYFRMNKLAEAKEEYRKFLDLSKNNCNARTRYAAFLYISKNYQDAINELKQVQQRCDPNNVRMLRLLAYCYYEVIPRDTASGFRAIEKLFQLLPIDGRVPQDYEYYGKLLAATNRDSLGIIQLRKAYSMEPGRNDLLSEIANAWFKLKNYQEVITAYNEKIAIGKDVRVTDYFYLGQAYYYSRLFNNADSVFMKLNDISPKFARGFYWRAKVNTQLDTTSELGLAKPFYESFDSLIVGDSINLPKNQPQLIESYSYLAYYYILKKDKQKALEYLKKKLDLALDSDDRKRVVDAIDQLEGRQPRK